MAIPLGNAGSSSGYLGRYKAPVKSSVIIKKRSVMSSEELKEEYKKDFIKNYAIYEGDVESGIVPLGQSIGVIKSIESVSDILEKCIRDAENALKKATNYII